MEKTGASEMTFDDIRAEPTPEDLAHDWLPGFIEALPEMRNRYAHGSSTLRPTVLSTFQIVMDLVNQLFPTAIDQR